MNYYWKNLLAARPYWGEDQILALDLRNVCLGANELSCTKISVMEHTCSVFIFPENHCNVCSLIWISCEYIHTNLD